MTDIPTVRRIPVHSATDQFPVRNGELVVGAQDVVFELHVDGRRPDPGPGHLTTTAPGVWAGRSGD